MIWVLFISFTILLTWAMVITVMMCYCIPVRIKINSFTPVFLFLDLIACLRHRQYNGHSWCATVGTGAIFFWTMILFSCKCNRTFTSCKCAYGRKWEQSINFSELLFLESLSSCDCAKSLSQCGQFDLKSKFYLCKIMRQPQCFDTPCFAGKKLKFLTSSDPQLLLIFLVSSCV